MYPEFMYFSSLKVFLLKFLYWFSDIAKKHGYGLSEFVKKNCLRMRKDVKLNLSIFVFLLKFLYRFSTYIETWL